jgi:hypothetical protein
MGDNKQRATASVGRFPYITSVKQWEDLCKELSARHGDAEIEGLRIALLKFGNPSAPIESDGNSPGDMILSVEEGLGILTDTLKHIRRWAEKGKTGTESPMVDVPVAKENLQKLGVAPHTMVAAAFRDYQRTQPDVMRQVKECIDECTWNSMVPLTIGLCTRERVLLAPMKDGAYAFKCWCSPRLLHMAKWVDARHEFGNSHDSELLSFFTESIRYESNQANVDDGKLVAAAAAFAVKRVWDKICGSSLVFNNPTRLLDDLKTVKKNLENGTFREAFGTKTMQDMETGRGIPTPDSIPKERHFATSALLEEFKDPMATLTKMQRRVLEKSTNPSTQVKCLDGKMRGRSEYYDYVGYSAAAARVPTPQVKPVNKLKEPLTSWRSTVMNSPDIKLPSAVVESLPMAAAAAGKSHRTDSEDSASKKDKNKKKAHLMMPLVQKRDAVCPQYLHAESLYQECSTFFFPDVKNYRESETASIQFYQFMRRFHAIKLDSQLNPVDQQPTSKMPYKGQRWPLAKVSKAIELLSLLEQQMSIDFEKLEVMDGDTRSSEHVIVTPSGRKFERVRQMNMSRWMYGYEEGSQPRNCWIELGPKERMEIRKHVQALLRGLRFVEQYSFIPGSKSVKDENKEDAEQNGIALTKEEIDQDPNLRGVNEFLAFLPTRLDHTTPLAHSVMGADNPQITPVAVRDTKLRGLRAALLEILSKRATSDIFRANAFSEEMKASADAAAFDWIGRKHGRFVQSVQSTWPLLALRAPPIGTNTFSEEKSDAAEMNRSTNLMSHVPFKMTVDAFCKGLTLRSAMYCATAYCFSTMAQTLCQFEVDRFLGDVLFAESSRRTVSDTDDGGESTIPRVPWVSSYRLKDTVSKSKLYSHPTGVSTAEGLLYELATERRERFARMHKRIDGLIKKATTHKDRVNMSAVYSILHEEEHSVDRVPGMISDLYALAETLFGLARQHTAALYSSSSRSTSADDSPFASAYLVQRVNDMVLSISRTSETMLGELCNNLKGLTDASLEEWGKLRRRSADFDRFRSSNLPRLHDLVWKRIGAGPRNSDTVYSVADQLIDLSRAEHVERLLYLATAPWMLGELVYDKSKASASMRSVSAFVRNLVNQFVNECFSSE